MFRPGGRYYPDSPGPMRIKIHVSCRVTQKVPGQDERIGPETRSKKVRWKRDVGAVATTARTNTLTFAWSLWASTRTRAYPPAVPHERRKTQGVSRSLQYQVIAFSQISSGREQMQKKTPKSEDRAKRGPPLFQRTFDHADTILACINKIRTFWQSGPATRDGGAFWKRLYSPFPSPPTLPPPTLGHSDHQLDHHRYRRYRYRYAC